jgi:hypothetical protein
MSDKTNTVSRRKALKIIGAGVGATGALSIYQNKSFAQHQHMQHGAVVHAEAKAEPPRFFTPAEMAALAALTELIIPTDDHSPGAKAAGVPAFIDLMVSSSPAEVHKTWRDGLAGIDRLSQSKSQKVFAEASAADQLALLTEIAKNEMNPKTPEEQFFRTLKSMTIDGYYTSEIGIHTELQYKGNSYNKTFVGCTHPEHQA